MEKSIAEIIEDVKTEICDNYCKFPEMVMSMVKDIDAAEDELYRKHCDSCPLSRL